MLLCAPYHAQWSRRLQKLEHIPPQISLTVFPPNVTV